MRGVTSACKLLVALALTDLVVTMVSAICCREETCVTKSVPDPNNPKKQIDKLHCTCNNKFYYWSGCCGRGSCNWFCCNCDYGCLKDGDAKFPVPPFNDNDGKTDPTKGQLDHDGDGFVSLHEAREWSRSGRCRRSADATDEEHQREFDALDLDKDGLLSYAEIGLL